MHNQSVIYPFISPFVRYHLSSVKQRLKSRKVKGLLSQNEELRDKYSNERCFIIGTAPSVKDFDLKLIKNENIIAINEFYLHSDL